MQEASGGSKGEGELMQHAALRLPVNVQDMPGQATAWLPPAVCIA
jgi:hypothetical protein